MLGFIGFSLFLTVSAVHVLGCIRGNLTLQDLTKPALMPLLALSAVLFLYPYLPASRSTIIVICSALAAAAAGDIILIRKEKKQFLLGLSCFLIEHVIWICRYAAVYTQVPAGVITAGAVLCPAAVFGVYLLTGKPGRLTGAGTVLYSAVLCTLSFTAFCTLLVYPGAAALCFFAGTLLFIISDCTLGYAVLNKPFAQSQLIVKLTYLSAQTLITAAAVLPFFSAEAGA